MEGASRRKFVEFDQADQKEVNSWLVEYIKA